MQDARHEFYDNRRPQHPMMLPIDKAFHVIRTEVINESTHADKGYGILVFKHYVDRVGR